MNLSHLILHHQPGYNFSQTLPPNLEAPTSTKFRDVIEVFRENGLFVEVKELRLAADYQESLGQWDYLAKRMIGTGLMSFTEI